MAKNRNFVTLILLLGAAAFAAPAVAQTAAAVPAPTPKAPAASPAAASSGTSSSGTAATPLPGPAILPDDSGQLLGLRLSEAWISYGAPIEVFPMRGPEAWQDDVVFRYAQGYSFFWYGDRLWQIRFQKGYPGAVYGVFLGDPVDKLVSSLGAPFAELEDSLLFRLPYRGFELRLRAAVANGAVADLYVYRADF